MATETMREIRSRIKSIKSTQKIARAMFLAASAKYRRAQQRMEDSRAFKLHAQPVLNLLMPPLESDGSICIVIAGDKGMSGGYNSRVIKKIGELYPRYTYFLPIGLKTAAVFRSQGEKILCGEILSCEKTGYPELCRYTRQISDMINDGKIGTVDILYTSYTGEIRCDTVIARQTDRHMRDSVIFEPDFIEISNHMLAQLLAGVVYADICTSVAREELSRRIAMDAARTNAQEMLDKMQLRLNRMRRAGVTQEIIEAVSGFGMQNGGV